AAWCFTALGLAALPQHAGAPIGLAACGGAAGAAVHRGALGAVQTAAVFHGSLPLLQVLLQLFLKQGEGLAPVAAGVLFLVSHLPEGAALLLEDGVVPKAVLPPGIKGDGAKALALGLDLVPIGEDAAHGADKVGAPLLRRRALELLQHGQAALAGLGE